MILIAIFQLILYKDQHYIRNLKIVEHQILHESLSMQTQLKLFQGQLDISKNRNLIELKHNDQLYKLTLVQHKGRFDLMLGNQGIASWGYKNLSDYGPSIFRFLFTNNEQR